MTTQQPQKTMVTDVTPSEVHSVYSPREGGQLLESKHNRNNRDIPNSMKRMTLEPVTPKIRQASLKLATWNVRKNYVVTRKTRQRNTRNECNEN